MSFDGTHHPSAPWCKTRCVAPVAPSIAFRSIQTNIVPEAAFKLLDLDPLRIQKLKARPPIYQVWIKPIAQFTNENFGLGHLSVEASKNHEAQAFRPTCRSL